MDDLSKELWTVEKCDRWPGLFSVYDSEGNVIAACVVKERAHLIGAASYLLAACEALIASIDANYWYCPYCGDRVGHGDFCEFESVENLIRTGVAEATGEAHDR